MTPSAWGLLLVRFAAALVVAGGLTIAVLWYGAGEQATASTQLPYVLVAAGAGLGLVATGGALYAAQRQRWARARVEDALARVIEAAIS
ncbi:MAG TPA: hypothetical protein VFA83_22435 [Acidimicrobiales bacterium]|nr:hypothetical protein [Acidimicrobiales bacterium]